MKKVFLLSLVAVLCFAASLTAEDWAFSFWTYNGARSDSMELTLGVDNRASDGFDSGLDIPFLAPPSGFYGYFVLNDTAFPDITMLSTDFKSSHTSEVIWTGNFGGDSSIDPKLIRWSADDLPLPPSKAWGTLYIGAAMPGDEVDEWLDMAEVDSFFVPLNSLFYFRFAAEGIEDEFPPVVENWNPVNGQTVAPTTTIEFDITDDVAGVDLDNTTVWVQDEDITELGEFTPIVGGYHFVYTPEEAFAPSETVSVEVASQDLAEPSHIMEITGITFYIRRELPPDHFPPRVSFWQPADGSTGNSLATIIRARVTDTGTGVDATSIAVTVNGIDVTEDLNISPTGVHDGEYDILYDYPGEYAPNTMVEVILVMADLAGNPAVDTLVFWTGEGEIEPAWFSDFIVWSYSGGSDTTRMRLTLGTDHSATDGFDPDYDLALPIAPPSGPYAYFPINDPEFPLVTMLTRDIRRTSGGEAIVWLIRTENPGDYTGVNWITDALAGEGEYRIGSAIAGDVPLDWIDMSLVNSYEFTPGEIVWVKYIPGGEDDTPPYLVASEPENGATGVSTRQNILVQISDVGTGVDMTSVTFLFDGEDVTEDVSFSPIPGGFEITYGPGRLGTFTTYHMSISASDYAGNSSVIGLSFTTGSGIEIPSWDVELTVFSVNGATGDTAYDNVSFGVDEGATDGFDPDFDVPIPIAPPSGFFAFFPLSDEEYPLMTMLDVDIKYSLSDTVNWTVEPQRLYSSSGSVHGVMWNNSAVPNIPDYFIEIGIALPSAEPDNWFNMTELNHIDFRDGENIYVRARQREVVTYQLTGIIGLEGVSDFSGTEVGISSLGIVDITDEAGNYSFPDLAPGTYEVSFTHDGYVDTTVTVELVEGNVNVSFTMRLITYAVSGIISVEGLSAGELGGTVVTIGDSTYVTQVDGSYLIAGIMPGEHLLTAEHPGYAAVETTITVEADMEVNLTIPALYYTVSGTVQLEGGGALDGTQVQLVGVGVTGTDTLGYYEFTDVEPGLANLVFTRPGYVAVDTTVLVEGDVSVDLTLNLSPVTISGTVYLAGESEDLSSSVVTINAAGYEPVITGASGYYSFADLDQDNYTLTASHEYYATVETTITADMDLTIDFNLLHLDGIADLVASFTTLVRPLTPADTLTTELNWTAPDVAGLTIDYYTIYRGTSPTEMEPYDTAPNDAESYIDNDVADGVTYYYYVVVVYTDGDSPESNLAEVTPVIEADPATVLVYDFDNGATPCDGGTAGAEEAITSVLDELSISYTLTEQDEALNGYELTDYEAVLVVTGIYDAVSTMIPDASLLKLVNYLTDENGKVYVEGPDFAKDYSTGSTNAQAFFNLFGVSFVDDGADETEGNVQQLRANRSLFRRYLTWQYAYRTQADRLVDELAPRDAGAQVLWGSLNDDGIVRGVYYPTADYVTILSSCYTGGIIDGDAPLTRLRYLAQVLVFLGIDGAITDVDNIYKLPTTITLQQNYPNPFNPVTAISYQLPKSAYVTLEVLDLMGRRVALLDEGNKGIGYYSLNWDATGLPTGVYFYRLSVNELTLTKKMLLIK